MAVIECAEHSNFTSVQVSLNGRDSLLSIVTLQNVQVSLNGCDSAEHSDFTNVQVSLNGRDSAEHSNFTKLMSR